MLTELSTLFKISLSKGREIITIEDELKHIGSNLFISNMIYSKKFTYSIELTRPCISTRPPNCYCSLWQKTPFYMPFPFQMKRSIFM